MGAARRRRFGPRDYSAVTPSRRVSCRELDLLFFSTHYSSRRPSGVVVAAQSAAQAPIARGPGWRQRGGDPHAPPWASRHSVHAWARCWRHPRPPAASRDINALIADWAGVHGWVPDNPHTAIGLLGRCWFGTATQRYARPPPRWRAKLPSSPPPAPGWPNSSPSGTRPRPPAPQGRPHAPGPAGRGTAGGRRGAYPGAHPAHQRGGRRNRAPRRSGTRRPRSTPALTTKPPLSITGLRAPVTSSLPSSHRPSQQTRLPDSHTPFSRHATHPKTRPR